MGLERAAIIEVLQADILRLQGYKSIGSSVSKVGLGDLEKSLPNKSFPTAAIHEFLSPKSECYAATCGFISGLLSAIIGDNGVTVWISASGKVFAPALKTYGLDPDRVIFIELKHERDVTWAMEEAMKCPALSAVVGELIETTFTETRRLQLATEHSQATGFIIRRNCDKLSANACVARWRISPQPSLSFDDLPGIGYPRWKVELLRVKNGRPGTWDISWEKGRFVIYSSREHQTLKSSDPFTQRLIKTG